MWFIEFEKCEKGQWLKFKGFRGAWDSLGLNMNDFIELLTSSKVLINKKEFSNGFDGFILFHYFLKSQKASNYNKFFL